MSSFPSCVARCLSRAKRQRPHRCASETARTGRHPPAPARQAVGRAGVSPGRPSARRHAVVDERSGFRSRALVRVARQQLDSRRTARFQLLSRPVPSVRSRLPNRRQPRRAQPGDVCDRSGCRGARLLPLVRRHHRRGGRLQWWPRRAEGLPYGCGFFPSPRSVPLRTGDAVTIDLDARLVGDDYTWTWRTVAGETRFEQSTFFSAAVSTETLRRRAASHVPELTGEDEIMLRALEGLRRRRPMGGAQRTICSPSSQGDSVAARSAWDSSGISRSSTPPRGVDRGRRPRAGGRRTPYRLADSPSSSPAPHSTGVGVELAGGADGNADAQSRGDAHLREQAAQRQRDHARHRAPGTRRAAAVTAQAAKETSHLDSLGSRAATRASEQLLFVDRAGREAQQRACEEHPAERDRRERARPAANSSRVTDHRPKNIPASARRGFARVGSRDSGEQGTERPGSRRARQSPPRSPRFRRRAWEA